MRDSVVHSDSRNPRFIKTNHQSILLSFCILTCGSQIKITANKIVFSMFELFTRLSMRLTVRFEF